LIQEPDFAAFRVLHKSLVGNVGSKIRIITKNTVPAVRCLRHRDGEHGFVLGGHGGESTNRVERRESERQAQLSGAAGFKTPRLLTGFAGAAFEVAGFAGVFDEGDGLTVEDGGC
jgi:hypothetical protein